MAHPSGPPPRTVGDLSESELISRITRQLPAAPEWMVVGIGDDAAIVEPARNRLEVFSVDASVEGIHFDRAFTPSSAIGHRALAVNLSDLAAMGAAPRLALLSLAMPARFPLDEFDGMIEGLTVLAARHRTVIAGGNLTRIDGPLVVDVTVVGSVKRRGVLTRGGARPGDEIYVTGSIGAAAAGLQMQRARLASTPTAHPALESCVQRYLYPEPRVRMGTLLGRNRAATACMDLSDGLADAVHQVAAASGFGAVVDADALPIDPDARLWFEHCRLDPVLEAVSGGDDYELLVAVRPRTRGRLAAATRHGGVRLTRIGVFTESQAVVLRRGGSERPLGQGFRHFR
jgi:thiamine-monophosphate kinase